MPFYVLVTLSLYLLSGCSSHTPAITQYSLSPSYSKAHISDSKSNKSIKLITTETLSSLNTKAIRYTLPTLESGAYLYARWSDTPAMMLNRLLASSLENEKIFPIIITSHSSTQSDWVLESELLTYEHRFIGNRSSQAVIDIVCRLIDTKSKQPIAAKRFTITVDAPSEDIRGGVNAFQRASEELTRQQIEWLKLFLL